MFKLHDLLRQLIKANDSRKSSVGKSDAIPLIASQGLVTHKFTDHPDEGVKL